MSACDLAILEGAEARVKERRRRTDALEMKLWVFVEKKVLLVDEVVEVSLEREQLREDL